MNEPKVNAPPGTPNIIIQAVVGSQAYGMATPTSDTDRLGVFMLPTKVILGRFNKGEERSDTIQEHEPDRALHELGKFVRLVSEANPTATELLWLSEYEWTDWFGKALIRHRHHFLSERGVKDRYSGYAKSQVHRLIDRGRFDPGLKPAKHGRHCARLVMQARQLLETGHLTVRLNEEQVKRCFEWGNLAETDPNRFAELMFPEIESMQEIKSDLPYNIDVDFAHDLLSWLRRCQFDPGSKPWPPT